jgi:hypothetical protein
MWNSMGTEEREVYIDLALQVAAEHKEKYPGK